MNPAKIIIGLLLLIAAGLALTNLDPLKEGLASFLGWAANLGPLGAVSLGAGYIIAVVFFFPASILTLGAGFAFGVLWGTVIVSIASTLGATLSFILGRTLLREMIEKKVSGNPKFSAVDDAVKEHGFKIVMLTRLSPAFPFNLLNYMYGLTNVRLRDYFFASWIGMFPGTVMYVYLGSAAQNLAAIAAGDVEGGNGGQKILLYLGLAATIAVTVVITRVARKALSEAVPAEDGESVELNPDPV
jgi:uncharacterized membrane protein YdjX (TVP38/TMEM64 family)